MAVINQVLHRMNSEGTYDEIYLKANMANVTGTLAIANGGTGANNAADARNKLVAASEDEIGFNLWDEQWEVGAYDPITGLKIDRPCVRSKNFITISPQTLYDVSAGRNGQYFLYNESKEFLSEGPLPVTGSIQTSANARFMTFRMSEEYGTTYNNDICIRQHNPNVQPGHHEFSGVRKDVWLNSNRIVGNATQRGGWNQLVIPTATNINGVTVTFEHGMYHCVGQATTTGGRGVPQSLAFPVRQGHIYLCKCEVYRQDIIGYFGAYLNHSDLSYWYNMPVGWSKFIADTDDEFAFIGFNFNPTEFDMYLDLQIHDLTDIFGAGDEPSIEEFQQLFPDRYYAPVEAGLYRTNLHSVGFNLWDEQWDIGTIDSTDGSNKASSNTIRSSNFIPCNPNTRIYLGTHIAAIYYYSDRYTYIGYDYNNSDSLTRITPNECAYIKFVTKSSYGTVYNNDICINIHDNILNGRYKSFQGIRKDIWMNRNYALGNAIVRNGWNQLFYVPDGGVYYNVTQSNGKYNFSLKRQDVTYARIHINYQDVNPTDKVLFIADFDKVISGQLFAETSSPYIIKGFDTQHLVYEFTGSSIYSIMFHGTFSQDPTQTISGYFNTYNLTEIFGAGNEPTIEQFKQLFPDDYYPYITSGFGDLLWENADQTSAFAAQTISFDISAYKFLMLVYRLSANDNANFMTELVLIGKKRDVICFNEATMRMRSITPTTGNNIIFYEARKYTEYGNASSYIVDNSILVPFRIYGIR